MPPSMAPNSLPLLLPHSQPPPISNPDSTQTHRKLSSGPSPSASPPPLDLTMGTTSRRSHLLPLQLNGDPIVHGTPNPPPTPPLMSPVVPNSPSFEGSPHSGSNIGELSCHPPRKAKILHYPLPPSAQEEHNPHPCTPPCSPLGTRTGRTHPRPHAKNDRIAIYAAIHAPVPNVPYLCHHAVVCATCAITCTACAASRATTYAATTTIELSASQSPRTVKPCRLLFPQVSNSIFLASLTARM